MGSPNETHDTKNMGNTLFVSLDCNKKNSELFIPINHIFIFEEIIYNLIKIAKANNCNVFKNFIIHSFACTFVCQKLFLLCALLPLITA